LFVTVFIEWYKKCISDVSFFLVEKSLANKYMYKKAKKNGNVENVFGG